MADYRKPSQTGNKRKAITHDVFSLGIGLLIVYHVEQPLTLSLLILVVWLAADGHRSGTGWRQVVLLAGI